MQNQNLDEIYAELGIDTHELGCVMLEVETLKVSDIVPEEELYFSDNIKYAQGIISEWGLPHVTLLFGLMQNAQDWKRYIDLLFEGIDLSNVTIANVETFDGTDGEIEYSCFVARVELTEDIANANANLSKLPHVDSFPEYIPHITLFYAKRNDNIKDQLIAELNDRFAGKQITAKGLVYD